jgi:uncharacterized protein (UPF0332 family)
MNWREFITLARGLAGHRFEGSQRSAISRAYYGAFNLSRRWLELNVTPIDNRGAHKQVWEAFRSAEDANAVSLKKWKRIATLGVSLRSLRNEADYDDIVIDLEDRAPRAVDAAEEIIWLLGELELAD